MTIFNVKKEILCYHVFLPGQREILTHYIFLFFWQEFQNRAGLCYFNVNNTFFHVDVISFLEVESTSRVNKGFIPCDPTNFPVNYICFL